MHLKLQTEYKEQILAMGYYMKDESELNFGEADFKPFIETLLSHDIPFELEREDGCKVYFEVEAE